MNGKASSLRGWMECRRALVRESRWSPLPGSCAAVLDRLVKKNAHQEDNLLAAIGGRTFQLVNLSWEQPFHVVRLESGGDILRIPPGTFHRSISDPGGSVVLNQAVREPCVSLVHEFQVYNSANIPALQKALLLSVPHQQLNEIEPRSQAA